MKIYDVEIQGQVRQCRIEGDHTDDVLQLRTIDRPMKRVLVPRAQLGEGVELEAVPSGPGGPEFDEGKLSVAAKTAISTHDLTPEKVAGMSDEQLLELDGIGAKTAESLREAIS